MFIRAFMRSFKVEITNSVGNQLDSPETKHVLYLDREYCFYFSNKEKANSFRVKLEKYYTNYCYLINDLYITTISNYRHYFFELKPFELKLIKEYISVIDKSFDYILSPIKTPNSNVFKYSRFQEIFNSLSSINAFLSSQARIKQDRSMRRKCEAFELHLLEMKQSAKTFNEKHSKINTYDSTLEIIHDKRHA